MDWFTQHLGSAERDLSLNSLVRFRRRKLARGRSLTTEMAVRPNQRWSMDFVSDKLADGRSVHAGAFWLEGIVSMTGSKVAEVVERAQQERDSLPESITVDNDSGFSGRALEAWAMARNVRLCFTRPGRPGEKGFIECLNVEWFSSLQDAWEKLVKFREHYNHQRLRSALTDRAPAAFAALHRVQEGLLQGYGQGKRLTRRPFPCNPIPLQGQQGTGRT
jgi:putative transposase